MGYRELLDSLHKEADRKIRAIRDEMEAEAEKIRAEAGEESSRLKSGFMKRQAENVREQEEMILKDVEKKARNLRLSAEKDMAERLRRMAAAYLTELRTGNYKKIFTSLAEEIPPSRPERIRVNPDDKALALEYFPDAAVDPESGISGGLEVVMDGGNICIANTFEKRLERAWEDILPLLMRDLYKEIKRHGDTAED